MTDEQFEEQRDRTRQQILAAFDLPTELTDAWEANHADIEDPGRPDEERDA